MKATVILTIFRVKKPVTVAFILSPPPLETFFWLKKGGGLRTHFLGSTEILLKKGGGDLACHRDIWYFAFKPIFTLHPILAKKGGGT